MIGASDDDLKMLVMKRFIIPFESGIVVIKHWKIHNYIRGDRKKSTVYPEEMALLTEKENGAYSLKTEETFLTDTCPSNDRQLTDKCQHRLGKVRLGKDSLGEGSGSVVDDTATADEDEPVENHEDNKLKLLGGKLGKNVVYLTDSQFDSLIDKLGLDAFNRYVERLANFIIEKNAYVKNHYETILKWYKEDSNA